MTAHDDRARDEQQEALDQIVKDARAGRYDAREIPADELAEAERYVQGLAQHSPALRLVLDERGRERDAARAEVERLRRALVGHLFDGESLSTREALRAELIEQGLRDSAELKRLRSWYEQVRAENGRLHRDRDARNAELRELRVRDEAAKAVAQWWQANRHREAAVEHAARVQLDALARAHETEDGGQDR